MSSTGFSALFEALIQTRRTLSKKLKIVSSGALSRENLEEMRALMLSSDMGTDATEKILNWLKNRGEKQVRSEALQAYLSSLLTLKNEGIGQESGERQTLILVVGVNGTGKTTTAAKLAFALKQKGGSILLIGADTYRAAGAAQLQGWSNAAGVKLVSNETSRDPSAVLFDGLQAAQAGGYDTAIADTAGRLHTSRNLMNEVKKMHRVATERFRGFRVLTYLTLDANLGQNSLVQAREFHRTVPLSGIVLTKMDGTARGGIVFPVVGELGIPVKYLGVGETLEDLVEFDPEAYVSSLLGTG
ncbi:MAG: signal recognition particle-docking protein FtsY [Fidelibacterota bacterium]